MESAGTTTILLLIFGYLTASGHASVKILQAINSGGPRYRDTNGITYSADTGAINGSDFLVWPYPFGGITGPDATIYNTCRYSTVDSGFTYQLRVDGDGWYGLLLQSNVYTGGVNQFLYNVTLNGNAVVLPFYDPFDNCGLFNICNEIVYFHICDGILYWKGESAWIKSKVIYNRVSLNFDKYGYVDGVLLAKGLAGHAKTIIKDKTILYFDPANGMKCLKKGPQNNRKRRGKK